MADRPKPAYDRGLPTDLEMERLPSATWDELLRALEIALNHHRDGEPLPYDLWDDLEDVVWRAHVCPRRAEPAGPPDWSRRNL